MEPAYALSMNHGRYALVGAFALLATAGVAAETHHHWSYSGESGPGHWSALEADYAACGKGKAQSPIDITPSQTHAQSLPALAFDYHAGALHIVNNGHTIQANVVPSSTLTVGKDRYELVQFHFHHPAEEAVGGKRADMVVHLVHRDAAGKLAVVAVPLRLGADNAQVGTLWHNLPHAEGTEQAPAKVTINPAGLLPASHAYYTYGGSLTTPPCTEGVRWFVLKSPVTISKSELATFARLYPANARPLQALNSRPVLASQ
jgi:carbonic anhydrase